MLGGRAIQREDRERSGGVSDVFANYLFAADSVDMLPVGRFAMTYTYHEWREREREKKP